MIPILCPSCGRQDWKIVETPEGRRNYETIVVIREDVEPMKQSGYRAVQCECKDCKFLFLVDETQAECVIEEFM